LVAQLLEWAGVNWTSPAKRLERSEQSRVLEELTRQVLRSNAKKPSVLMTKTTTASEIQVSTGRPPSHRKKRVRGLTKKHWLRAGVLLVASIVATSLFVHLFTQYSSHPVAESDAHTADIAPEASTGFESMKLSDQSSAAVVGSGNGLAAAPPPEAVVLLEQLLDPGLEREATPDERRLGMDESLNLGSIAESLALDSLPSTAIGPDPGIEIYAVSAALESIDEPDAMVSQIEGEIVETESESFLAVPAQMLRLDSTVQVMAFPKGPSLRLAKWKLRLDSTEQLLAEPQQLQELTGKATLTWNVTPKITQRSNPAETLRIVVQATLAGRSADLRWTVVAVRDDLPISLALAPRQLEQSQAILLQHQERLRVAIEAIKARSSQSGVPRELRSALSAQRRFLEEQTRWVDRALQLSSDAALVTGQISSGLSVQGVLVEQAGSQAEKVVLRIGEIEPSQ
jgi:hypothetical protein